MEHSTKNTFSFADDYDDGDDNNGARTRLRQDDRLCRRGNRVHKGFLVAEHCHSMEYSLVIDSDWQQSFPRHMLQWVPWWRYLNRWQIFNCWWFITPSTSPPPVIKECTEGSLRITRPSFCLSIISYQSSHYHSTPPPPEENDWRKCYLLPWPPHSFRTYNV